MIDINKIKVRGYHIDSYGHVNNTRYLEFLEETRWILKDKYFQYFDGHHKEYGLVVVNNTIDYYAPAFLGEILKIETSILKIGTKSVQFLHKMVNDETNQLITSTKATFVFFNHKKNISEKIPEKLIKNFKILTNNM